MNTATKTNYSNRNEKDLSLMDAISIASMHDRFKEAFFLFPEDFQHSFTLSDGEIEKIREAGAEVFELISCKKLGEAFDLLKEY